MLDFYQELRYLFLLSICKDKHILLPNITTFLPKLPFGNEKVPRTSNEILIRILIRMTMILLQKQYKYFVILLGVKTLLVVKQLSSNFTRNFRIIETIQFQAEVII